MGQYRKKPLVVEATQWWRNGDHPKDDIDEWEVDETTGETFQRLEGAVVRFYNDPQHPDDEEHMACGRLWHSHGWIDGYSKSPEGIIVCPGDWVVTSPGGHYSVIGVAEFEAEYEPWPPLVLASVINRAKETEGQWCRCGILISAPSPGCAWHKARWEIEEARLKDAKGGI